MPPDLTALRQLFATRNYLLTAHASNRAAQRAIYSHEIEEVIAAGEVSYPPLVKVITVYEPSPTEWEADFKARRR